MRKTKHTRARRARFVAGGVVGAFAIVAALLASPTAPSGEIPAVAAASVSSTAPIRTVVEPATLGTDSVVGEVASLTVKSPARHRHRDPCFGELCHERVEPFPGRFACDRYAAARRSTSFSCSSSRFRFRSSRISAASDRV